MTTLHGTNRAAILSNTSSSAESSAGDASVPSRVAPKVHTKSKYRVSLRRLVLLSTRKSPARVPPMQTSNLDRSRISPPNMRLTTSASSLSDGPASSISNPARLPRPSSVRILGGRRNVGDPSRRGALDDAQVDASSSCMATGPRSSTFVAAIRWLQGPDVQARCHAPSPPRQRIAPIPT